MKRLELVIVQLDEAMKLIRVGRVPHLRLAHILLDSAIELVMHRMVEQELRYREGYPYDPLQNLERLIRAGRGDEHIRAEVERLTPLVTSKKRRKQLDHGFDAKVRFLIERTLLPVELGPVLEKLHVYRNETYHRDKHRIEIVKTAVMIHFDVACTVLDQYDVGILVDAHVVDPQLERFRDPSSRDPFEVSHNAARQLRAELGLDLPGFRAALIGNLLGRLEDIADGLAYAQEEMTSRDKRPGDALILMQSDPDDIDVIFNHDALRSRPYPITMDTIRSWTDAAAAMESLTDRHALFAEFARIEDEFETLKERVQETVWAIDEAANTR